MQDILKQRMIIVSIIYNTYIYIDICMLQSIDLFYTLFLIMSYSMMTCVAKHLNAEDNTCYYYIQHIYMCCNLLTSVAHLFLLCVAGC